MEIEILLLCTLTLLCSCQAGAYDHVVTVCPDDFTPRNDCVTLSQLQFNSSQIKSNSIIKFLPATFQVKSNMIITLSNVYNITLDGNPQRANIMCIDHKAKFLFHNVSGLLVQNMNFAHCKCMETTLSDLCFDGIVAVRECVNVKLDNITFQHGHICGLLAVNVYGELSVSNAKFKQNHDVNFCLIYKSSSFNQYSDEQTNVTISKSEFSNNQVQHNLGSIIITILSNKIRLDILIVNVNITNNTCVMRVLGIYILIQDSLNVNIRLDKYNSSYNTVVSSNEQVGDVSDVYYLGLSKGITTIEIVDTYFVNNKYNEHNESIPFIMYDAPHSILSFSFSPDSQLERLSISTGWYNSIAWFHSVLDQQTYVEILESVFANNTMFATSYYIKGSVVICDIYSLTISNCSILNNTATGLYIDNSQVHFYGTNVFRQNQAYNGGGMAILKGTQIYFSDNVRLIFEDNIAKKFGGGLYVDFFDDCFLECFIKIIGRHTNVVWELSNNSANTAGNDILWWRSLQVLYWHICWYRGSDENHSLTKQLYSGCDIKSFACM